MEFQRISDGSIVHPGDSLKIGDEDFIVDALGDLAVQCSAGVGGKYPAATNAIYDGLYMRRALGGEREHISNEELLQHGISLRL